MKRQKRLENKNRKLEAELRLLSSSKMETLVSSGESLLNTPTSPQCDPEERFNGLRRTVHQIKRSRVEPKLYLRLHNLGSPRRSQMSIVDRGPAMLACDLQSLILYSILGPHANFKPRWCEIKPWRAVSQVVMVVIDMSKDTFLRNRECFPFLTGNFLEEVDLAPSRFFEELFTVSLSAVEILKREADALSKCVPVVTDGCSLNGMPISVSASSVLAQRSTSSELSSASLVVALQKSDVLMTVLEMIHDQYPLPISGGCSIDPDTSNKGSFGAFMFSRKHYAKITEQSPLLSLDCEMCMTDHARQELTRISIVDEDYNIIYDTLVKPQNRIVDYLTKYSGITHKMLEGVRARLEDVQAALKKLLPPDAILVGHSINFDLKALRIYHPYVVDLSVLYNLSGQKKLKSSLQTLAYTFLGERIQESKMGHCSVEDACTAMKLVKLKLQRGMKFGNISYGWKYESATVERSESPPSAEDILNSLVTPRICNDVDQLPRKRRRFLEEGIGRSLARLRDEANQSTSSQAAVEEPKSPPATSYVQCLACSSVFKPMCRNEHCCCRQMKRSACDFCIFKSLKDESSSTPSRLKGGQEECLNGSTSRSSLFVGCTLDQSEDSACFIDSPSGNCSSSLSSSENDEPINNHSVPSCSSFASLNDFPGSSQLVDAHEAFQLQTVGRTELIFEFLAKKNKKKSLWIGPPCDANSGVGKLCSQVHTSSHLHCETNTEGLQKLSERMLENDLCVLNVTVKKRNIQEMRRLDQMINDVVVSAAVRSLLIVSFASDQTNPNGGVSFFHIKPS